jgi:formamidopyrimidine-DNA glycosylase
MSEDLTLPVWNQILKKHPNQNVCVFLMDQHNISGVGNYIKAEALYYSGISPLRKIGSLSELESDRLYEGVRLIPRLAYNNRNWKKQEGGPYILPGPTGSSRSETFQLHIYGQSFATKTKTPDGRTTYWDPSKQK